MNWPIFLLSISLLPASAAADSVEWITALGGKVKYNAAGHVVEVNLRASWVNDAEMIELSRMPYLERLDLSHTRITDEGLLRLKPAPRITDLNLFYTEQITDQGMAAIRGWTHLKRLNVRGTRVSDGTLEIVSELPQLEALDLSHTPITENGLDYLVAMIHLKELSIGSNRLSDERLFETLRLLPTLTYLDLSGAARALRSAQQAGRGGMSDRTVQLMTELENLRTLRLGHTGITSQGIQILSQLPHLERLALTSCPRIDDSAVSALAGWKSLKYLDVQNTQMTEAGVEALRRARPDMAVLANPGAQQAVSSQTESESP